MEGDPKHIGGFKLPTKPIEPAEPKGAILTGDNEEPKTVGDSEKKSWFTPKRIGAIITAIITILTAIGTALSQL